MNTTPAESAIVVAFPSDAPGGMNAPLAQHFGHCDVFTVVSFADGAVGPERLVPGVPHEHGGCLAPVQVLAEEGVTGLVAAGMGRRPLLGFRDAGITVYHCGGATTVGEAVEAFRTTGLRAFDPDAACGEHH